METLTKGKEEKAGKGEQAFRGTCGHNWCGAFPEVLQEGVAHPRKGETWGQILLCCSYFCPGDTLRITLAK